MTREDELVRLEGALGYEFEARAHLEAALVHRSYCAEHAEASPNERLEFLGDAVLGLSVTDHIFEVYPELPEGELTKIRASVVNAEVLAIVAAELDLGSALLLAKGEDASGGRAKPSILADTMEAVIAAVYLDGGRESADRVVLGLLGERIQESAEGPGQRDVKTRLQELTTQLLDVVPRYVVTGDGPDHSRNFYAKVMLRRDCYGEGEGRTKKEAEKAAARAAWQRLQAEQSGEMPALATSAAREGNDA
ncbi:MAG: ribonuclease III [Acidimicrobiia bacterium]